MELKSLLEPAIKAFIHEHEKADVAALALKKPPEVDWPYKLILEQIKSRQKAALKIPSWLEHEDIVLPAADVIEQASSDVTAAYKAGLVSGRSFADLTGGAGIDSAALAESFEKGLCVEMNSDSAERLAHNFKALGLSHIEVRHQAAEDFLKEMDPVDVIYLDPQRRYASKKGQFFLESGAPNILELIPQLQKKARKVLLKAAPMLDMWAALEKLEYVHEVHILGVQNECKEVLYLLDFASKINAEDVPIKAVELRKDGQKNAEMRFTKSEENSIEPIDFSKPQTYLFDPYSAFMKSGAYQKLARRYGVSKLNAASHLYTSDTLIKDFPGRKFEVVGVYGGAQTKNLPKKANIGVRGYPSDVSALEKKFGIKTGGEDFLFAALNPDGHKVVIHCKKALV